MLLSISLCLAFPFISLAEARRVTPHDFAGAKQPQVAVSGEGTIYVVFGKETGIYISRSEDVGANFRVPTKIGVLEKLAVGMRRGPRIATTGQTITVTAISHATGNLYSWASKDRGSSWSMPAIINTVTNSAREGLHALAGDGKSKLISVWLDLRSGKTELWSSVSKDGGANWKENRRIYQSPDGTICECCHPSAIFTPEGEIVVMWRNWLHGSRDIYRAASSDGGLIFSEAQKIGTSTWLLAGCPMDGGSLAAVGDEINYAWRKEQKLFITTELTSERLLAEAGTHPVVVPQAKGVGYLWQNNGNLHWKSSLAAPTELLVRNAGYAAAAWSQHHGKPFVVWEGNDGIYMMEPTDR